MKELSDNELMLKIKSGDSEKLGLLYERHKNRLLGYLYKMNGNSTICEDMVQNVFMRILKYSHTYTEEGRFTAWMFLLARNVNNDHFRKNSKHSDNRELSTIDYLLKDTNDLEKKMESQDNTNLINFALDSLSPEKREVLILSRFWGLKFVEIAEILGCSEGNAKVKAHRALKELKEIFLKLDKN